MSVARQVRRRAHKKKIADPRRQVIQGIVSKWSRLLGQSIRQVRVTELKNKLVSISKRGVVTVSKVLLDKPVELQEYVIAKEMAKASGRPGFEKKYFVRWQELEKQLKQPQVVAAPKKVVLEKEYTEDEALREAKKLYKSLPRARTSRVEKSAKKGLDKLLKTMPAGVLEKQLLNQLRDLIKTYHDMKKKPGLYTAREKRFIENRIVKTLIQLNELKSRVETTKPTTVEHKAETVEDIYRFIESRVKFKDIEEAKKRAEKRIREALEKNEDLRVIAVRAEDTIKHLYDNLMMGTYRNPVTSSAAVKTILTMYHIRELARKLLEEKEKKEPVAGGWLVKLPKGIASQIMGIIWMKEFLEKQGVKHENIKDFISRVKKLESEVRKDPDAFLKNYSLSYLDKLADYGRKLIATLILMKNGIAVDDVEKAVKEARENREEMQRMGYVFLPEARSAGDVVNSINGVLEYLAYKKYKKPDGKAGWTKHYLAEKRELIKKLYKTGLLDETTYKMHMNILRKPKGAPEWVGATEVGAFILLNMFFDNILPELKKIVEELKRKGLKKDHITTLGNVLYEKATTLANPAAILGVSEEFRKFFENLRNNKIDAENIVKLGYTPFGRLVEEDGKLIDKYGEIEIEIIPYEKEKTKVVVRHGKEKLGEATVSFWRDFTLPGSVIKGMVQHILFHMLDKPGYRVYYDGKLDKIVVIRIMKDKFEILAPRHEVYPLCDKEALKKILEKYGSWVVEQYKKESNMRKQVFPPYPSDAIEYVDKGEKWYIASDGKKYYFVYNNWVYGADSLDELVERVLEKAVRDEIDIRNIKDFLKKYKPDVLRVASAVEKAEKIAGDVFYTRVSSIKDHSWEEVGERKKTSAGVVVFNFGRTAAISVPPDTVLKMFRGDLGFKEIPLGNITVAINGKKTPIEKATKKAMRVHKYDKIVEVTVDGKTARFKGMAGLQIKNLLRRYGRPEKVLASPEGPLVLVYPEFSYVVAPVGERE